MTEYLSNLNAKEWSIIEPILDKGYPPYGFAPKGRTDYADGDERDSERDILCVKNG